MTLVDTSVWIAHFRKGDRRLANLLADASVLTHPFVLGELALGGAESTRAWMDLLLLPMAPQVEHAEVVLLSRHFHGSGIGWVDAHLIAAARVVRANLYTRDFRLAAAFGSLPSR